MIVAAIPIKPFGVAKARLSPVLGAAERSRVGRAIAGHTVDLATRAGAEVTVVTADRGVQRWAARRGAAVLAEDPDLGGGLDGAAATAARFAERRDVPWVLVHADLPLATVDDLRAVFAAARHGSVIVPSHDGGTNVIGSHRRNFAFSYGRASFHRHLARMPEARVMAVPRLALDLDTPADLARARSLPAGRWLADLLERA